MPTEIATLSVIYFIEADCLGAKGEQKIISFCPFLSQRLNQTKNSPCIWKAQPLIDRQKPHFQYFIIQKKLTSKQAQIYLQALNIDIKSFENSIDELVVDLIDEYLSR